MSQTQSAPNLQWGTELQKPHPRWVGFWVFVILLFILPKESWAQKSSGIQLGGTTLQSCTADKKSCVELKSKKLEGAQFRQLFFFPSAQVTIHQEGKAEQVFDSGEGYWDARGQFLTFSTANAEYNLDLRSFELSEFKLVGGKR